MTTLVVPAASNSTGELLAETARARGLDVVRPVTPYDIDLDLRGDAHLYAGPRFAAVAADLLDIDLREPADDWLIRLPDRFRGRDITAMSLGEARDARTPTFVKQPREKDLPAAVYTDGGRLPVGDDALAVLVSDVVTWVVEYRLFVVGGAVAAGSRYARFGHLDPMPLDVSPERDAVLEFADRLLAAPDLGLPDGVVIDVGLLTSADRHTEDWAVVEANMAWFASAYAAEPDGVLDVVLRAAGPRHR